MNIISKKAIKSMFCTNSGFTHQTVDKKLFSPRRGRIALSANERIAEFLDFAIQAKFAYVNKLSRFLFCSENKKALIFTGKIKTD